MKTFFLVAAFAAMPLAAENAGSGQGYVSFGLNSTCACDLTSLKSAGGGGDAFVYKGLSVGGDLGYHFTGKETGFGLLSANPSYHFTGGNRDRKLVPFVTGGYALAFRNSALNLYNYGGGITYWFKDNLGVRLEVRDYRDHQYHFLTAFRVGLSFR